MNRMQQEKKMVDDHNTLSYQCIEVNHVDARFAKVTSCVIKTDRNGKNYLQIMCKGRDGINIYGRMFGAKVSDLYANWNRIANSICVLEYEGSEYLGEKCITITKLKVLPPDAVALARQDLFDGVVPNLDSYLSTISELISTLEVSQGLRDAFQQLLNDSLYKELTFKSDPKLVSSRNGSHVVLLSNLVSFMTIYDGASKVIGEDLGLAVFSALLSEAVYCRVTTLQDFMPEMEALRELAKALKNYKINFDEVALERVEKLCSNLVLSYLDSAKPCTKYSTWIYSLRESIYNFMVLQNKTQDLREQSVFITEKGEKCLND